MTHLTCVGCGWCCLDNPCQESHILHGYLKRCPDIVWNVAQGLYRCRLAQQAKYERLLSIGLGCCAPLNPWRQNVVNHDEDLI